VFRGEYTTTPEGKLRESAVSALAEMGHVAIRDKSNVASTISRTILLVMSLHRSARQKEIVKSNLALPREHSVLREEHPQTQSPLDKAYTH
jgi:hypothetical protein